MSRRAVLVALATASLLTVPVPAYAAVPGPPSSVAASGGPGRMLVTWSAANADDATPVTGYAVYRKADAGPPALLAQVAPGERTYLDVAAPAGPLLSYGVAALNADGAGETAYSPGRHTPVGEVVVSDYSGSQVDLYARNESSPHAFVDVQDTGRPSVTPAVSPDGSRIVYAKRGLDGDWDLFVRAANGTGPERQLTFAAPNDLRPSWSPDGRRIAFTRGERGIWTVAAAGGAASYTAEGWAASWLSDSRTLVVANDVVQKVVPGESPVTVPYTARAFNGLSVSPDGRWIAYSYDGGDAGESGIAMVRVSGGAGPTVFTAADDPMDPTWRGDGMGLYATVNNSGTAAYSWNGSSLVRAGFLGAGTSPAYRATGLGFLSPPLGTRTTATIRFALRGPYTSATCRLDGGAATDCSSGSWSRSGLATGRHTLVVTAEREGFQSRVLAHTWTVDVTAPVARRYGRARGVTLLGMTRFQYEAVETGSGVRSYDVRYRRARYSGGYGRYYSRPGWLRRTSTSVSVPSIGGYEFCFSARARDHAGNLSAWSAERCISAPVDDAALAASPGWRRVRASGYFHDTYTGTGAQGATLTWPDVEARMLTIVVTRCPTCGSILVYIDGEQVATYSLRAPVTQHRHRLYEWLGRDLKRGTVRVVSRLAGQSVRIDGLAALRTTGDD